MLKKQCNTQNSMQHNIMLLKEYIKNRPYDDHTVDLCVFIFNNYSPSLIFDDFFSFAVFYLQTKGPYNPDCLSIIQEHFLQHISTYEDYFNKGYLLFKFLSHFTYVNRVEFIKFSWVDFLLYVHKQGHWSEQFYATMTIAERRLFDEKCKKWSQIKQKMFQKKCC